MIEQVLNMKGIFAEICRHAAEKDVDKIKHSKIPVFTVEFRVNKAWGGGVNFAYIDPFYLVTLVTKMCIRCASIRTQNAHPMRKGFNRLKCASNSHSSRILYI